MDPPRLKIAAVTVAGLVVPFVAAFAAGLVLQPIPVVARLPIVVVVLIVGLVVGGRVSARAAQRLYPPTSFTRDDPAPAVAVVRSTVGRLGPRNHVVFGLEPLPAVGRDRLHALISVKSDRMGAVAEIVVQVPYGGHTGRPEDVFASRAVTPPEGWELLRWAAGEYALLTAPPATSPRTMVVTALDLTRALHDLGEHDWQLTFVV